MNNNREPIAIIGLSCRFPGGADNPHKFWELLENKRDAITDIPADRWDIDSFYHPDYQIAGKMRSRQGGFLKEIDHFDASFFGIPPVEAVRMDPQQRLLLENTYIAIEDAGLRLEELSGSKTGVFVGISSHDYGDMHLSCQERMQIGTQSVAGCSLSIAANRISYIFNLKGPSLITDTACASSLTAVHLACRLLQCGDANLAIAAGVNIIFKPEPHIGFSQGGFLSPDSRSRAFDARANGYVRSEGIGVLILKPLQAALEDNDKIYALILGSAINEDGRTQGISMPDQAAQVAVLEAAYKDAGINPSIVDYVEAHGTGTAVGDPVEAAAIGKVLGKGRSGGNRLLVGSVKANIGHLEPAAGVAGLIKLALVLKKRRIPPNIHFEIPNPNIDFEALGIRVPVEPVALSEEKTLNII
jgi:acyl transferase domain-containing protein